MRGEVPFDAIATFLIFLIGLPAIVFLISGSPLSWEIPALRGFNFQGGMVLRPEFLAQDLAARDIQTEIPLRRR